MYAMLMSEKEINDVATDIFNARESCFKDCYVFDSIFELDGDNKDNLANFMRMIEEFCKKFNINSRFDIKNTYFDMGAGMKWTQIIARTSPNDEGYQLLNPRDHQMVVSGRELDGIKDVLVSVIKTHLGFVMNEYQIALNNLKKIQESL